MDQSQQSNFGPQEKTAPVLESRWDYNPHSPPPSYQVNYPSAPQQTTFTSAPITGTQPQPSYQVNYASAPQQTTFASAPITGTQPQPSYQVNYGNAPQQNFQPAPVSQPGYQVNYGNLPQQPMYAEPRQSWYRAYRKSIPQWESISPAFLIFTSGGISSFMGLDIMLYGVDKHERLSWYIAVIIGSVIAAALANKITKRLFYIVASVLVIINGALFVAVYDRFDSNKIVFARYCDGIAFGLALIPTIIAGSEQSSKRFRGYFLTIEYNGLILGALLRITALRQYIGIPYIFIPNRAYGIFTILLGASAFLMSFFRPMESPIFLLRQNKEQEAADVIRRLYKPRVITNETYQLLNECKALVEEDRNRGSLNVSYSLMPTIKMMLFRCFVSMSTLWPITSYTLIITMGLQLTKYDNYEFVLYFYILSRLIGVCISSFTVDIAGRRIPSAIAFVLAGIVLITIGTMHNDPSLFGGVITLLMTYQTLSGIVAPASTVYLGEAFTPSVKSQCICVAILAEYILQIVLSYLMNVPSFKFTMFFYTVGVLQVIYGIIFYFIMPETKQETLRRALKLFESTFA